MPAGLRHVLGAAVLVSLITLAAPGGALADGGGKCKASACQVYTEGAPTAGSHTPTPASTPGPGKAPSPKKPVPPKTVRMLAHAGKDKAALARIISDPSYGAAQQLHGTGATSVVGPSLLGAAFSLGVGPTALFAALLATLIGLAVYGGVRGWRRRRSTAV